MSELTKRTRIEVDRVGGRHRVRQQEGLVRAQRLHGPPDRCRLALLATTGLLLGGDEVDIDVRVGPGACLELTDVAGTVAYHGRGRPARWSVRIRVQESARLTYAGQPFVVAAGADVSRELHLDVGVEATIWLRDTLVLGRTGESPGRLRTFTSVQREGNRLLVEELALDASTVGQPGLVGAHRVVDTLLGMGMAPPVVEAPAECFQLLDPDAFLVRFLGDSLAVSPLHRLAG